MKFIVVHPEHQIVRRVEERQLRDAVRGAGLDPAKTDHGMASRKAGYVVDEFGLFKPAAKQHYFSIEGRLIAGAAVFYGIDEAGETIDMLPDMLPSVTFYLRGASDVEVAIALGRVIRPAITVNGDQVWEWPQPAPAGFMPDA